MGGGRESCTPWCMTVADSSTVKSQKIGSSVMASEEQDTPSAATQDPVPRTAPNRPLKQTKTVERKSLWEKKLGDGRVKKRRLRPKKLARKIRKNFVGHKAEFCLQLVLFILCVTSAVLFFDEVDKLEIPILGDSDLRIAKFQFSLPCVLCFGLLFNVGANVPAVTPLLACISYYWYPEGIRYLDQWYYEMNPDERTLESRVSRITYQKVGDTDIFEKMFWYTFIVLAS